MTGRWKRIAAMSAACRPHCALSAGDSRFMNAGTGGAAGLRKPPAGIDSQLRSFQVIGVVGSSSGSSSTSRPKRGSPGISWMTKYQPQSSDSVFGSASPWADATVRSKPKNRMSGSTLAVKSGKRISLRISASVGDRADDRLLGQVGLAVLDAPGAPAARRSACWGSA